MYSYDLRLFLTQFGFISKLKIIKNIEIILLKSFDKIPTLDDLYNVKHIELVITSLNISSGHKIVQNSQ